MFLIYGYMILLTYSIAIIHVLLLCAFFVVPHHLFAYSPTILFIEWFALMGCSVQICISIYLYITYCHCMSAVYLLNVWVAGSGL